MLGRSLKAMAISQACRRHGLDFSTKSVGRAQSGEVFGPAESMGVENSVPHRVVANHVKLKPCILMKKIAIRDWDILDIAMWMAAKYPPDCCFYTMFYQNFSERMISLQEKQYHEP